MRTALPIALLALLAGAGCLPSRMSGHLGPGAFYAERDHYRVRYAAGEREELLESPWTLSNFEPAAEGRVRHERADRSETVTEALIRGRSRPTVRLPRHDLHFARDGRDSVIFVRTIALREPWSQDDAATVLRRSVASMGAAESDAPDLLGTGPTYPGPRVRFLGEGPAVVDGENGYFVRLELVRPGAARVHVQAITLVAVRARRDIALHRRYRADALLVFGHLSDPAHHEEEGEAFAGLVRRVDLAPRDP